MNLTAFILERIFGISLRLTVTAGNITVKAKNMETSVIEGQSYTLSVVGQNKHGANVAITGVPSWSCSDPAVVSISAAADGLSAHISGMAVGTATITVSIDGFTATDTVTVAADTALAGITLTASTPA